ncbi:MAG: DUF3520 domain-containing protein [Sphingobacteriales bacterium]|nr:MAG: DUF3520 domain-containing protein [Sphingobacteriales bacterium]
MGFAGTTLAQSGAISGTVLDENGDAMIGALIKVTEGGLPKGGAKTDEEGNYTVKPLQAGRYDVEIAAASYAMAKVTGVIVSPDKTTALDVKLKLAAKELKGVIVSAYKVPLIDRFNPGARSVVAAEQIEKMPARTTDGVVSTSPGVYSGADGLKIGGGRTQQSVYYVDGVQMSRGKAKKMKPGSCFPPPPPAPNAYYPGNESYKKEEENGFKSVSADPLSTLSVDVDRASYSNIRRFINDGQRPPADAVRVEEMINYFDYDYPQPKGEDPIAIVTELIDCPWKKGHKLLQVGMKAKEISTDKLPASNIVFLIDVSGSMMSENKLPLVKSSLTLLVNKLREEDRVSIVVYAGSAGLVLPPTSGADKETIINALDRLQAGGSTAGGEGIQLAYKTAAENFMRDGNNRVIMATDGDFNVGISNENELENLIVKQRDKGIYLTCLGYGMGNYKDSKMEMLADKGNGNYAYIDNMQEANKTLVKEFGGTIFTIAKDVKAQIEFNPKYVKSYRLVGYENRVLNNEDFKDDKKDAGDMGSGHSVTILYEIVPAGGDDSDALKYQHGSSNNSNELATIKFRYKRPNANTSKEMVYVISPDTKRVDLASNNIRFASSVAMFGMLLKDSEFKGVSNYNMALTLARSAKGRDKEGYRSEYIKLVKAMNNDKSVEDGDNAGLGWNGID